MRRAHGPQGAWSGKPQIGAWLFDGGTLGTLPVAGGAPREIAKDVALAGWAPDGKRLAVIRQNHLEFPLGTTIYTAKRRMTGPWVSPAGDRVAFFEGYQLHIVDSSGHERFLSRKFDLEAAWMSAVWRPSSNELWVGGGDSLFSLRVPSGKERLLFRGPRGLGLRDIDGDGKALVTFGIGRSEVWSKATGQTRERDLSVLGSSDAMGITPDGKSVLINENSFKPGASFYLGHTDGSPPQRLGDGYGSELSADGAWVVVVRGESPSRLVLVPTGAGDERALENGGIEEHDRENIRWSQDGRLLVFGGHAKGHKDRLFVQDVAGGPPRALTPEGVRAECASISPDGRSVLVQMDDGHFTYPSDGGPRRPVAGFLATDFIWRNWSTDGRFAYVWNPIELPLRVFRVEIATGRREPWKTILPQDPAGIWNADLMITPDGQSYAYNCRRAMQDLYLVEGLR